MAEDRSKFNSGNDPEPDPGDNNNAHELAEVTITQKGRAEKEVAQKELGGRGGLEPTRYGDWEKAGRCIDF